MGDRHHPPAGRPLEHEPVAVPSSQLLDELRRYMRVLALASRIKGCRGLYQLVRSKASSVRSHADAESEVLARCVDTAAA